MDFLRKYLIILLFIPSFVFAQEETGYVPDLHSSQYILGSIDTLPGDYSSSLASTGFSSRIVNFYTRALTYGLVPDRSSSPFFDSEDPSISFQSLNPSLSIECSIDPDSSLCSVHNASLIEYAIDWQCRPEASAPAQIINSHYQQFYKSMFGVMRMHSTSYIIFAVPDSGINSLQYTNNDPLTSTSTYMYFNTYLYRPNTNGDIVDLAFSNPSYFNTLIGDFMNLDISSSALISVPNVTGTSSALARNTFASFRERDFILGINSIQLSSNCVWNEEEQKYDFIPFTSPPVNSNNELVFADGTTTTNPNPGVFNFEGLDTYYNDGGEFDYLYNPDPIISDGYIPPDQTAEEWLDNPDNEFGTTHPDSPNNPLNDENLSGLGEEEFCSIDKETGECSVLTTEEELSDYASIALKFKLILDPIFDFSALGGSQSCPTYSFGGSVGGFNFSQDLEIDCTWLNIIGGIFLMMSSFIAFRIVFGD